jgi:TonB-linked SusC/RagA family outer membrane protein
MVKYIRIFNSVFLLILLMSFSGALIAQESDTVVVVEPSHKGIKVSGVVYDNSKRAPIEGLNVSVAGYSSAITGNDGSFSISVPSLASMLIITGTGWQTKEVALKGRKEVKVDLYESTFGSLYDEAILPNGVKPISQVTNATVSLHLQENWVSGSETADNLLQGRIPGLNVIRKSGTPGIGSDMFLRGISSLNTTHKPLVIVDGMIYDTEDYNESIISGYSSNPFSYIDIKDIDDITFIKDAVSQYGAKGANGVLLITTAHARELSTRINFGAYAGANLAPSNLPVMNSYDYRVYLSEILKSQGQSNTAIQSMPFMSDDVNTPGYYAYHNNTDWQDKVLKNSLTQNYYLKVSGGDNIAKYALSMGYMDQNGVVDKTGLTRYNTRFNGDFNMSPRLKANTNLAFTYNENQLKDQGMARKTNPIYLSLIKSPFTSTNEITDLGIKSPNLADADIFNISNPRSVIESLNATSKNYRFFGSVNFNFELAKDLNISSLFGVTYDKIRTNLFVPRKGIVADTLSNAVADSKMGSQVQRLFSIYNDTRLSYKKRINEIHNVDATLGVRYQKNSNEEDLGYGYNSATDDLQTIGTGVAGLRRISGGIGKWTWLNYYANIDYQLLNKYFVNFNMAFDGSSRYGKKIDEPLSVKMFSNQFGFFPSAGVAWLVSSENFMAQFGFIEMLKLRATYGITGNDDIGNYSSKQLYIPQNFLGVQGVVRGNIANPYLQWETNKKLNIGIDLSLFNERVTLSADVYHSITDNMLTIETIPTVSGFDYVPSNSGTMENKGIEAALNTRILKGEFKWDMGVMIAANHNEVTNLPIDNVTNTFGDATYITKVGGSANLFYGYKTSGIYVSDEEASSTGYFTKLNDGTLAPFQGGDVRFADLNGDHEINEKDRAVIGNPNPWFTGMVTEHFSWKQFTLEAAFSFSYGNDVYNYTRAQLESVKGYENQTQNVVNRWRSNGQTTDMPRANWGDPLGNSRFSDRWIEDGSYIRLRTLALSYTIPVRNEYIKYANLYLTGNNLVTFTNYLGYDPEFSAGTSIYTQGVDATMVPQYKSVLIGIKIGL